MTHPVDELMSEHRLIERMLSELYRQVVQAPPGVFSGEFVEAALDFFSNFADRRHHEKEEKILFPALAAAGIPRQGGPIGVMEYEHSMGRSHLAAIRSSLPAAREGSKVAIEAIREGAAEYIQLLSNHILKEDMVLFRMAQNVLCDQRQLRAMEAEFHDESNPVLSADFLTRYTTLVEECAHPVANGDSVR